MPLRPPPRMTGHGPSSRSRPNPSTSPGPVERPLRGLSRAPRRWPSAVPKISSYPNNPDPDDEFEFVGTDPENQTQSSSGTTETVTLAEILSQVPTPITTEGDLIVGGAGGTPQRLAA